MWIQFNNAFLSIVENRENTTELLVRARVKGDIEKVFPEADVFEDNNADYKYRAFISKAIVAEKIMLKVTERATEYLKSVTPEGDYVTLGVKGGGCSGFTYVWDHKSKWPDVKWSEPINDILVVDPVAEMFVLGCTVDWINELGGNYLKIITPNATASCGCGESFAV